MQQQNSDLNALTSLISKSIYPIWQSCTELVIDSRKVTEGCLFWGIKGERFDGSTFWREALEQGASYVVADQAIVEGQGHPRLIPVPDTILALQQLATHHRQQLNIPILAIGGSNGKTTTKELIKAVLQQKYSTYATEGNLNNHLGVPLSILHIQGHHHIAVIELGANHRHEHELLCAIAQPTHAIITNVGKDHLEGFGSIEGTLRAALEIDDWTYEQQGLMLLNMDDPLLRQDIRTRSRLTYGLAPTSTGAPVPAITGRLIHGYPNCSVLVRHTTNNQEVLVTSQLVGGLNALNIIAAMAAASCFDVDWSIAADAVAAYKPTNFRSEWKSLQTLEVILDAYNANPSSMLPAIAEFQSNMESKGILALGDMNELGEYALQEHQAVLDSIDWHSLHEVWLVGPIFSQLEAYPQTKAHFFSHIDDLLSYASNIKEQLAGKVIFIKGSRSIKMERLLEVLD